MASFSKGALGLLSTYDSTDSDSEDEIPGSRVSVKRIKKEYTIQDKRMKVEDSNFLRLPLPSALETLFLSNEETTVGNPAIHEGRIRSFPHERGNWSTYVFIPYEPHIHFQTFVDVIVTGLQDVAPVKHIQDLHISLTRTVVLRHHWIDPFTDSVREFVKELPRFSLSFNSVNVYCNEEKTRTFVGLSILTGQKQLNESVNILNKCLAEFRLPPYYENPSFHLSVAWCLGDQTKEISCKLPELQFIFEQFFSAHPDQWTVPVDCYYCKSGNKLIAFQLAAT